MNIKEIMNKHIDWFQKETKDIPYYHCGLMFSSLFSFCALVKEFNVDVIIDSGTGKHGLSAEVFSILFPDKIIYTIDKHKYYHNEKYIKERLKDKKNIVFINGSSKHVITQLLTKHKNEKVAIEYDGPKGVAATNIWEKNCKFSNVLFSGFDDCGNNERDIANHENILKFQPILITDEKWYQDKYGFLDDNRYYVEEPNDKPVLLKNNPIKEIYKSGTGHSIVVNKNNDLYEKLN